MVSVFLGIGSNIRADENLAMGLRELRSSFGDVAVSPVYRSAPYGFKGDDFLNAVARIDTDLSPAEVHAELERIQTLAGRTRGPSRFLARTLDIDLLLYADLVLDEPPLRLPREDVLDYSFVLRPLADIAPELIHPLTGRSMAAEWADFDEQCHPLQSTNIIL